MSDATDAAATYLAAELEFEWQRKASLEARSIAVTSANVALAALYFGVADIVNSTASLREGASEKCGVIGLILLGLSTLSALVAGLPFRYGRPDNIGLQELVDDSLAADATAERIAGQAMYVQVKQIGQAGKSNSAKVVFLYLSSMASAAGTCLLVIAVAISTPAAG